MHLEHYMRVGFLVIIASIAWCQMEDGIITPIISDYEPFIDRNGNHAWDAAEPFIDRGNGVYDIGEQFIDINQSGKSIKNHPKRNFKRVK